jgi:hypothetical protein
MYHIRALPVVHLPVALAEHVKGNLGSGCLYADVTEHAGLQTITNNFLKENIRQ